MRRVRRFLYGVLALLNREPFSVLGAKKPSLLSVFLDRYDVVFLEQSWDLRWRRLRCSRFGHPNEVRGGPQV